MKQLRYYVKSFFGVFFFIVILFISAGRLEYYQGWMYAVISFLGWLINVAATRNDIDLLEERSQLSAEAKKWDMHILKLSGVATLAAYITAGLDSGRYHWSAQIRWDTALTGIILLGFGQLLFLYAKKSNSFFSSVVRIQHDRGQTVCTSGPYRYVRHPGYLGMIISWLGFPVLLESVWSIIPSGAAILLLIIRTHLEDALLTKELTGYRDYAGSIQYKLVPGLW